MNRPCVDFSSGSLYLTSETVLPVALQCVRSCASLFAALLLLGSLGVIYHPGSFSGGSEVHSVLLLR